MVQYIELLFSILNITGFANIKFACAGAALCSNLLWSLARPFVGGRRRQESCRHAMNYSLFIPSLRVVENVWDLLFFGGIQQQPFP